MQAEATVMVYCVSQYMLPPAQTSQVTAAAPASEPRERINARRVDMPGLKSATTRGGEVAQRTLHAAKLPL